MLISVHPMHATLLPPYVPVNWTQVPDSSFGTSDILSIASNGLGQYVAVGRSGKLATSNNALEWQQRTTGLSVDLSAVAYGDEKYIIGGASGKMAISSNGISWSEVANSSFGASPILSIDYFAAQGLWIAVGGSGAIATSPDGISWTRRAPQTFGNSFANKVYSAGNIVIAVGANAILATSNNGIEWIVRNSSFNSDTINSVSSNPFAPYRYAAVGTSGKIAYSDNGTFWIQILPSASFAQSTIRAVAANEEGFVAAGASGRLATSANRISWTQRNSSFDLFTINDLFISEQLAIGVGNSGKIGYSD
jgi:photosystem II stability/assembly factor-like uncharacterized protein